MTTLLIATRNAHKAQEISHILGGDVRCRTLNDFPGAPAAVEDAETFQGNAAKKVLCLAEWLTRDAKLAPGVIAKDDHFYILADDSGLEVDALGGAPGVHSARFAADGAASGNAPDAANNTKLIRLLTGRPLSERAAQFRCVLAVLPMERYSSPGRGLGYSPEQIIYFEGACEGRITDTAAGGGGFGYDPLFVPNGFEQSFAELGADIKNKLSHRARALAGLREFIAKRNS